jgi:hypothetical protein
MRELPRGTITFLFTDIAGSTRLLHELGQEEDAARLAEHRRVLREAFERQGGVEVDTQGMRSSSSSPPRPVHSLPRVRRKRSSSCRSGWACTPARRC